MNKILYQVDSFTAIPFKGNPAGVYITDKAVDESRMKAIATEMNLSETAFLHPAENGYNLRWFTPAAEVELCGHATLASAHILWEQGYLESNVDAVFHTLSGELTARNLNKGIELNFPATPLTESDPPEGLIEALGVTPLFVGQNKFDYLVEVGTIEDVANCKPNFGELKKAGARGVMITAQDKDGKYDFVSRFFAPGVGIDEDPVTGSAHCTLGPYWAEKLGKTELSAYQASQRGGEVGIVVDGDRIKLTGQAITVFKIEMV